MSNKFEILMNQLDMPLEMRNSEAFLNAEIEKVLVHKVSRVWEFHFSFALLRSKWATCATVFLSSETLISSVTPSNLLNLS